MCVVAMAIEDGLLSRQSGLANLRRRDYAVETNRQVYQANVAPGVTVSAKIAELVKGA
jgi:hypothetical protein